MLVSYDDHVARCFRQDGVGGCEYGHVACPMRPMVERLAMLLGAKLHSNAEDPHPEDLWLAHAVLEAIREPSNLMLTQAGFRQRTEAEQADAKATWVTMIDMAMSKLDDAFDAGWKF